MKEKDFQIKFNKWCKYNCNTTARFELKLTKGSSLPFSAVKPHQEANLASQKLIYKIPDDSIGQKPFDSFVIVDAPSFIVVMFYKRGCKRFYMIPIEEWLELKKTSQRKSLTEEMAKNHGMICELDSIQIK